MVHCDLERAREIATNGRVDYNLPKSVLRVANLLGVDLDVAKTKVRALVQSLRPEHFYKPGEGHPPPPCDAYVLERQERIGGRWEAIRWYVKIGITAGKKPEEDILWVESCHES